MNCVGMACLNQPEALRLAQCLEQEFLAMSYRIPAAAELRKLYEINEVLLQKCHTLEKMVGYKVDHIFDDKTPLTLEKIQEIWVEHGSEGDDAEGFARAIEKAHGIGETK